MGLEKMVSTKKTQKYSVIGTRPPKHQEGKEMRNIEKIGKS
jgi:hypothetical protein